MPEQRFMVTIVTDEKITDDIIIDEMSQNIADAIVAKANDFGIVPEDSEAVTRIVYVKGWYQDKEIIEHTDADFLLKRHGQ